MTDADGGCGRENADGKMRKGKIADNIKKKKYIVILDKKIVLLKHVFFVYGSVIFKS